LRLGDFGFSAGLNLQWSMYRYTLGRGTFGHATWAVEIAPVWTGPTPRVDSRPVIESRAGCDLDPPRLVDDAAMQTLESFVWADHPERLAQLRAAIAISRADPPRVDRQRAIEWLPGELAGPVQDLCTVVYHSSVWIYIPADEQAAIQSLIEQRGAAAGERDPLVWLRHEDGAVPGQIEIRMRVWPGGEERLIGMGHPHGRRVEWRGWAGAEAP
jgi:hypothetical protein